MHYAKVTVSGSEGGAIARVYRQGAPLLPILFRPFPTGASLGFCAVHCGGSQSRQLGLAREECRIWSKGAIPVANHSYLVVNPKEQS